jgi:hypothetical protein
MDLSGMVKGSGRTANKSLINVREILAKWLAAVKELKSSIMEAYLNLCPLPKY